MTRTCMENDYRTKFTRANNLLRLAIAELKHGYGASAFVWKNTRHLALVCKEECMDLGFSWQACMIEHWINRYSAKRIHELEGRT